MFEMWRIIPGYKGRYCISDFGRVYSNVRQRIMRPGKNPQGYKRVKLSYGSGYDTIGVHKLVKEVFDPIPLMFSMEVDHINCDKEDNTIWNLEWVTHKENVHRYYKNHYVYKKQLEQKKQCRKKILDTVCQKT